MCEVTECAPGEVFEFAVVIRDKPVNTWRYELAATEGGGTDVTESFRLPDNLFTKVWRPLGGFLRENRNRRDMLRTLERVKGRRGLLRHGHLGRESVLGSCRAHRASDVDPGPAR